MGSTKAANWFSPGPRWAPIGTVLVNTGTLRNLQASGWYIIVSALPAARKSPAVAWGPLSCTKYMSAASSLPLAAKPILI